MTKKRTYNGDDVKARASSTYVAPQPSPFDIENAESYDYRNLPGDIGTHLAITPFQFRLPTEQELSIGRGSEGWRGRSGMLANSLALGGLDLMTEKIGSKLLGRLSKLRIKKANLKEIDW